MPGVKIIGPADDVIGVDSTATIATGGRLVALIGVHDLVVVDTQDALLITRPERAQEVKQIVEALTAQGADGAHVTAQTAVAGEKGRTPWAGAVTAAAAVVVAWVIALPRLVPSTFGDHGTYISVAERLLAGDRLYVDVWDNKDPLFYGDALALGRLASPLGDILLEVTWVLGLALSVLVLARAAGARRNLAFVAGLGATPLLLTGPAYESGMTHLPGLALLLGEVACAVRSRWVVAGALVGLLLLTKLILAPVALGALLVVALHRRATGGLADLVRRRSAPSSSWRRGSARCGFAASSRAGWRTSGSTPSTRSATSQDRSTAPSSATCCGPSPRTPAGPAPSPSPPW